ncbi:hypothetical protein [Candidatus Coxiella mudrowiae]|uniref:hypothetical protein n=1 Tax=Candidatus Coxiella mudrowiae TaxID=2054173 RepID=UPI0012FEB138|nr:hypothetical protein [Candidatus Coxiella mudrowiae]
MNLLVLVIYIILPCIFFGISWAIYNTVSGVAASMSVSKNKVSVAIGSVYTFFNLVGSICLAIAVVIF